MRRCPTEQVLLAYHLGTLPEADVEAVAEHLEACAPCEAAIERLDTRADPLLAALRHPAPSTMRPGRDENPALPEPDPTSRENWPRLPGFEVLAPLGRGGMGVVYKARQKRPNRLVALKRLGPTNAREMARARTESEALARLPHPNIVQIHEVVEHQGWTYLVLEYVSGGSLESKLTGRPQAPRATAELLEDLARAVQYAHRQGIIHRDLKPANILLTGIGEAAERVEQESGRKGDRERGRFSWSYRVSEFRYLNPVPKVADFGIAKQLTADCGETRDGDVMGTPNYMAPEQAEGRVGVIGPATDVYSLGVILYEMLTGRVPLQGPSTLETLMLVRSEEPVPPRRLQPRVPSDLQTICLKCLEKEPARRYASAAALADDLRRFLKGEPILARPTAFWERAWKWAKRRPGIAALSAAVVLVATLGFGLVAWQWHRAEDKAAVAAAASRLAQERGAQEEQARQKVEELLAGTTLSQGVTLCESGEVGRGLLWLAHALELADRAHDRNLERVARRNLSSWRTFLARPRAQFPHEDWVWAVARSPDGRSVVTGSKDRTARIWDAVTGQPRGEPLSHSYPVWAVAFSPDGQSILTGSGDDARVVGEARLWDAATGRPLLPALPHGDELSGVAFAPDGRTFLTVCSKEARLWKTADGRPVGQAMRHPSPARPYPRAQPKLCAILSPDGSLVATGGEDGTARLWDAATGQPRGQPLPGAGPVLALAFSPDGKTLLTGCYDGVAQTWDVATGKPRGPALPHRGLVKAVTFSADGQLVATGSTVEDIDQETGIPVAVAGEARLWNGRTGRHLGPPLTHPAPVWSVALSPNGGTLMTGCQDAGVRFFLVATGAPMDRPVGLEGTVTSVAFSPDGTTALATSAGGSSFAAARLVEPPAEPALARPLIHRGEVLDLAFSPDGLELLSAAGDRTARLWNVTDARPTGHALPHAGRVTRTAFSRDGRTFLTGDDTGQVYLWDRARRSPRQHFEHPGLIYSAAFSPDDRCVLIGDAACMARLWETDTGRPLSPLLPHRGAVWGVAFNPDGKTFHTVSMDSIRLWDRETVQPLWERVEPKVVNSVTYFPKGDRALFVIGGIAHLRDAATGAVLDSPRFQLTGGIQRLALSPDGQSVLVNGNDGVARLMDVATGRTVGPAVGRERVRPVAFSPDGRWMASGNSDGKVALWETPQPLQGTPESVRMWAEVLTGAGLDAETIRELNPKELAQRRRRLEELGGPATK